MRDFLNDVNIVGATMMARTGELSRYCLDNLLKYCNSVVVLLDNPDSKTKEIVEGYANKYKEIDLIYSNLPVTEQVDQESRDPDCVRRRFKELQGPARQLVLDRLHERNKNGEKIDILLWPDSDEIWNDNLPNLLNNFWTSKYKAVVCKAVDVFLNFSTIHDRGMSGHTRIFKYFPELTATPYRWSTNLLPLRREERMKDRFTLIHLALLNQEMLDWKVRYWGFVLDKEMPLWRTGKDVRKCSPDEIEKILKRPSDITVREFLRGGELRMPAGVENSNKALIDTANLLDEMGIKYWLAFGTCLQIYRDGKIDKLSWDNDFIMDGADLLKFDTKLATMRGFVEIKVKKDIPTYIKDGEKSNKLCIRTICIKKYGVRNDIDIIYKSKCGKYGLIPKGRVREQFVGQHPIEWFDNEKLIEFKGKKYRIPSNTEEYLKSNYGENWVVPIYCTTPWPERQCRQDNYEINDILYDYNIKK